MQSVSLFTREDYKNDLREILQEMFPTVNVIDPADDQKDFLSLDEGLSYINERGLAISKSTLYKKTADKEIPFQRWGGKKIVFVRQELDQWIGERLTGNDATGGDEITNTVAENARRKGRA